MAVTESSIIEQSEAMIVKFRDRDYVAEAKAHSLPRIPAHIHPLSSSPSFSLQVGGIAEEKNVTLDPLRAPHNIVIIPSKDTSNGVNISDSDIIDNNFELLAKEWTTFKRFLVQKFPPSKTVAISSVADLDTGSHKVNEKASNLHPDKLDDPLIPDEDVKFITQQEFIARLSAMRNEISCAWSACDYFLSLKLAVKVAGLLRDTTLLQFYPTSFTLVTEILDMLGDMVWERIKHKAEFLEDGTQILALPDDFQASDVCSDAKETCQNWFCKIGSIRDLLPRIYLELAILPCWRFLLDDSSDVIQRLLAMMRGLGSPLVSAYCHLYLVYCVQKLPTYDNGYLITCIRDISLIMLPIISSKEATYDKDSITKQVLRLMEPPVDYTMKCIFKDHKQAYNILVKQGLTRNLSEIFGKCSCVSLILHHLLKGLPPEVVQSNALHILDLIECSIGSSIDQCMNFRLLGFRLYETETPMEMVNVVLERVIQNASQYQELDSYLKVMEGYIDIVLQNQMTKQLEVLLEGIAERACNKWINDGELESLQSVFIKILSHIKGLEDVLELKFFAEIVDVMRGTAKNVINMHILEMATRNVSVKIPTTIQFLFEVAQGLHNGQDFSNLLDSDMQPLHHLLSRFVHVVDFGTDWERHLTFLIECRASFASADVMKVTLVHHSNCLVRKALKNGKPYEYFDKSCLAFSEATIPSIAAPVMQLFLYLETAEVALRSGLISHSDGLIDSAISSLQSLVIEDTQAPMNIDGIVCLIQKLCSFLVMVPGNPVHGVAYIPKIILSLVNSQSWRKTTRLIVRTLCAILLLLAALSQHKLPYFLSGKEEVPGNDLLYFDDPSYLEELASFGGHIVLELVHAIQQEASPIARGSLALESCNCIASVLKMDDKISSICNELMEIAGSSLSTKHNYFLSTSNFLSSHLQTTSASNR